MFGGYWFHLLGYPGIRSLTLCYAIRLHFSGSNNVVEYEALINGLRIAVELGTTRLYVHGDSELVIDQVMKESSCKSPLMVAYC